MPAAPLLLLTLLAALLEWAAVWRGWRRVEYAAKPAVMLLLFAWLWTAAGLQGALLWFGLALLLSLLGDVLLLMPPAFFIGGLAAFLAAHVCYVVGFNLPPLPLDAVTIGLAVFIAFTVLPLIRRILQAVAAGPRPHLLRPVQVYATALALMLYSALVTLFRPDWSTPAAGLAALGGALFVTSDILLAWNLFVRPLRHGRLFSILSYHLGQVLLVAAGVLQYGAL